MKTILVMIAVNLLITGFCLFGYDYAGFFGAMIGVMLACTFGSAMITMVERKPETTFNAGDDA